MQEINDAWAVLRSPARRAAYDTELLEQQVAVGASVSRRSTISHVTDDMVAPTPMSERPPPEDDTPNGCGIFFAVIGVLTLGTIVIAIVAAVLSSSAVPDGVEVRTQERFATGTCVLITPASPAGAESGPSGSGDAGAAGPGKAPGVLGGDQSGPVLVEAAPCTGNAPRSGRVTGRVKVPLPCPRGSAAVVLTDEEVSLCVKK